MFLLDIVHIAPDNLHSIDHSMLLEEGTALFYKIQNRIVESCRLWTTYTSNIVIGIPVRVDHNIELKQLFLRLQVSSTLTSLFVLNPSDLW